MVGKGGGEDEVADERVESRECERGEVFVAWKEGDGVGRRGDGISGR